MSKSNTDLLAVIDEKLALLNASWSSRRGEAFVSSKSTRAYVNTIQPILDGLGITDSVMTATDAGLKIEFKSFTQQVEIAREAKADLPAAPEPKFQILVGGEVLTFSTLEEVLGWIRAEVAKLAQF